MTDCALPNCALTAPTLEPGALICTTCTARFARQLDDIIDYLDVVRADRLHRPSERGSPGYASTSPANDLVIAMFDPRSTLNGGFYDSEPEDPYDAQPDHVVPVVSTIVGWAQLVVDEHDDLELPALGAAVQLLADHLTWIACQGWAPDAAEELGRVHHQLAAAVGDAEERPLARCIDMHTGHPCEGPVVWIPGQGDAARCTRCKRPYRGLDLTRLRAAQEAS